MISRDFRTAPDRVRRCTTSRQVIGLAVLTLILGSCGGSNPSSGDGEASARSDQESSRPIAGGAEGASDAIGQSITSPAGTGGSGSPAAGSTDPDSSDSGSVEQTTEVPPSAAPPAATYGRPSFNPSFDQSDRSGGGLAIDPASGTDDYRPSAYSQLVFADEFDGAELDRSKWCTRFSWGGGSLPLQVPDAQCTLHGQGTLDFVNDEWQRYRDYNWRGEPLHVLRDGVLALRATKNTDDPHDLSFEAAMLRTKQSFQPDDSTSYYFTFRVKLPSARGTWPMIWLVAGVGDDGASQWPPEIDILEAPVNDDTETIYNLYQHLQVRGAQTDSGSHEYSYTHPDYNADWGYWKGSQSLRGMWLELGTEWRADHVCYYVNGIRLACENYRWVDNDGAPANPAILLINMAVGGTWSGKNGVDLGKFPLSLELDHVRIYRR